MYKIKLYRPIQAAGTLSPSQSKKKKKICQASCSSMKLFNYPIEENLNSNLLLPTRRKPKKKQSVEDFEIYTILCQ